MEPDDVDELRRFFAVLSDESRLRVAAAIIDAPRTVRELATDLSMKEATVSRNVSMLAELGLVRVDTDDGTPRYRLDVEALRSRRRALLARERRPSPADDPGTPEASRIVLGRFFDGERLKEIPTDRQKRLVVLAWLAGQFDEGQEYPERDVNEIIKRHHPDASALRRYLIDFRFMQRENGIYRRVTTDA